MQRAEAVALKESDLTPAEAITVVLSQAGWIRTAKGSELDPTQLNYRAGDSYLGHASGKSNQRVYLLDSTGRSYGLLASGLPSARGQGEPVTSKLSPPAQATFTQVLMGDEQQQIVLASTHGYGFVSQLGALDSNAKAGKVMVSLPDAAQLLSVVSVSAIADRIAVLSSAGRLLVYALADLPVLNKGKGNKLIQLETTETVVALCVFASSSSVQLIAGSRALTLKPTDLAHYSGKRGARGHLLPRGYQKAHQLQSV